MQIDFSQIGFSQPGSAVAAAFHHHISADRILRKRPLSPSDTLVFVSFRDLDEKTFYLLTGFMGKVHQRLHITVMKISSKNLIFAGRIQIGF